MVKKKKVSISRETFSLAEYFDRKSREETVWGKEPFEYDRKYNGHCEKNTIRHRESGLAVWNGCADLIKRVDKRYCSPEENRLEDRTCVFWWTSEESFRGTFLTKPKEKQTWKDILCQNCQLPMSEEQVLCVTMSEEQALSVTMSEEQVLCVTTSEEQVCVTMREEQVLCVTMREEQVCVTMCEEVEPT